MVGVYMVWLSVAVVSDMHDGESGRMLLGSCCGDVIVLFFLCFRVLEWVWGLCVWYALYGVYSVLPCLVLFWGRQYLADGLPVS